MAARRVALALIVGARLRCLCDARQNPDTARSYHDEALPKNVAKLAHFCPYAG